MDTQRLILFVALSFLSLMLWDAWQLEQGAGQPQLSQAEQQHAQTFSVPVAPEARTVDIATGGGVPRVSAPEAEQSGQPRVVAESEMRASGTPIHVETDLLSVIINSEGGDLRQVDLRQHGQDSEHKNIPFRLMSEDDQFFVAQTGIMGGKGTVKSSYPDHHAIYEVEQTNFVMAGEEELQVPMVWHDDANGIKITKTYIFHHNSYKIDVVYHVENSGTTTWKGGLYGQLLRNDQTPEAENSFIYTYTGGVTYTNSEHYQKVDFDEMANRAPIRNADKGWVAMIQHYFLAAVVPDSNLKPTLYTDQQSSGHYAIGAILPVVSVPAGESGDLAIQLYTGPKDQERLELLAEGLELTVDYGWLTFLAQPLFWILNEIQDVVSNWGLSIILLTILIKLVFFKLSETSYRSMARMRKLSPRLTSLKERYGDDRQKMNEAMMKIYREEKVNPMGGCLPILVQIPVFIALYWVLLESVEIRQAPFMLWIQDLSAKDPYYILPLLMGGSMLIQQRLNPAPIDPIQQKVMMVLPVVFTVFFAFFPAGLVLYWVVNNVISISQQWYITKKIEAAG
ncbi:MAG: membrane protein insertase YidC [Gammaproteobacteria bacterium]|uniref:Membrane protein insertase YidC n=1 Tax=Candidatus Thiopontia autotrophica TaxID=2841688 RepID=A0A8J6TVR8_9GAMM|nr:membrane protein insertase YidC [Candidatus Thiopontia autotrophica]MBL6968883.1 membrane protein insertase YidC [Gammaproteobacteria bacterium]